MRVFIAALPSLLLAVSAKPTCYNGEYDVFSDNNSSTLSDRLFRRVRIPGGAAGGDPPTASQLFLVGDSSLAGGCSGKLNIVDGWLNEARLLHNAVEKAYTDYSTNKVLAVLLNQYLGVQFSMSQANGESQFSIKPTDRRRWQKIGSRISGVTQFLDGGGLKRPQKLGEPPRIFCSGDAGELVGWSEVLKNVRGEDIPLSKDPETGEVTQYVTLRGAFGASTAAGGDAYWFKSFNGYSIGKRNNMHPGRLCGPSGTGPGVYASTGKSPDVLLIEPDEEDLELGKNNRHILFCPKSFDPGTVAQGDKHAGASLADAISSSNYGSGAALDKILPKSATMYHELYHLTDNRDTSDPYYQLTDAVRAGLRGALDVVDNPESWTFLAMACYIYLNPPHGKDPIVFLSGVPSKESDIPF